MKKFEVVFGTICIIAILAAILVGCNRSVEDAMEQCRFDTTVEVVDELLTDEDIVRGIATIEGERFISFEGYDDEYYLVYTAYDEDGNYCEHRIHPDYAMGLAALYTLDHRFG